jgi:hypothetical protein
LLHLQDNARLIMQFEQLNLFDSYRDLTLPLFSLPKKDELFTSWVVRLAHDHHVKAFTFTNFVFQDREFWKIDKDRSATDSNIKAIYARTHIDMTVITNTTLKSYEGKISPNITHDRFRSWIMHQVRLRGEISANYILYCPSCLKKDETPYFRKKWRLGFSFCCIDCSVLLHDCCPRCNKPALFHRHSFGLSKSLGYTMKYCYSCHFDLSSSEVKGAKRVDIENQTYLYDLLDRGFNSQFNYSHLYFDGLLHLCQLLISKQNREFNTALSNERDELLHVNKRTGDFCSLSLEDRTKIINAVVWIFQDWPNRFIDFCKRSNLFYYHFFRKKVVSPYWLYMPIKQELFRGRPTFTKNSIT